MNKGKLTRRTALAAKIRDRHRPPTLPSPSPELPPFADVKSAPYRIVSDDWPTTWYAVKRDEARELKRENAERTKVVWWIEQRQTDGSYRRVR
jgi:hypothetical protein